MRENRKNRGVWLPVRMTLLQNYEIDDKIIKTFDYQSEWHYSKTINWQIILNQMFDYQSEWHYSKTWIKYNTSIYEFDYQSEWHYSKTRTPPWVPPYSLITSQNDTTPKPFIPPV